MDKEKIILIGMLLFCFGTIVFVMYTINQNINNATEEELKSINPFDALKAITFFTGSVIVGAFIYSFWWYPKKCVEYENKILKENKEHMEKMENL